MKSTSSLMGWYCIFFLPGLLMSCASPMDKDWIKTQEDNSLLGFTNFIDRWPSSSYKGEAENKIDQLQFLRAQLENTESAYEEYLQKFPKGQFIADAKVNAQRFRVQNEERAFAEASAKNSSEALETFLWFYPESTVAQEAGEGLEALYLKVFENASTTTFFYNFLKLFPNSSYKEKALQRLESLHFEHAITLNNFVIYERFLQEHPQASFQKKAREKLEKAFFDKTKEEGSISKYENFLMKFPQGNFSEPAKEKLEALKEELKKITLLNNDAKNNNSITTVSQIIKNYQESSFKNEVTDEVVATIWEIFSQKFPGDKYNCSTTLSYLKQDFPKALQEKEPFLLGFAPQKTFGYGTWEWTVTIFEIGGTPAVLEKKRRLQTPEGEVWRYVYASNDREATFKLEDSFLPAFEEFSDSNIFRSSVSMAELKRIEVEAAIKKNFNKNPNEMVSDFIEKLQEKDKKKEKMKSKNIAGIDLSQMRSSIKRDFIPDTVISIYNFSRSGSIMNGNNNKSTFPMGNLTITTNLVLSEPQ